MIAINKYELMLIVNPDTDEERQKVILDRSRATVEADGGSIVSIDEQGKKKMQYEIKKQSEGIYSVLTFTAEPATLTEIERVLGITDEVMRFMALRLKA